MNTTELRRRRFFDALARVLVFALFIVLFVAAVVLAPAALLTGCAAPGELPPGAIDFVTNAAQRVVVAVREAREQDEDPAMWSSGAEAGVSSGVAGSASSSTTEHTENAEGGLSVGPVDASVPSASSVVLDFRYGGVKAKPAEDSRCRISKLKIGGDSLSFHWDTGIPSDWKRGATEKGPMILACAFYRDGSCWIGGKFDWIDEHRSGRSLENIHGGYGGWNAGAWNAAKKHAFCVMSFDGKYRSNLLEE